jgi:hypothetical protein
MSKASLAVVGLWVLAVAAPAVGAVFPAARIYGPSETWKWAALAVGLVSYAAVLILSERQPTALRKLACYSAGHFGMGAGL